MHGITSNVSPDYGVNPVIHQGQYFLSQASPEEDDAESLSSELKKKKELFGRLVSPLTLPSVLGKAAARGPPSMLPPKAPPAPTMNYSSKRFGGERKETSLIDSLLQRTGQQQKRPQVFPPRCTSDSELNGVYQGGGQLQHNGPSYWSQSGCSSIY